uniref:THAP-type domain-containing protein n=1 Tax=Capra hircus TaxID=9925 RepID=A0A8C2P535_CAPHI
MISEVSTSSHFVVNQLLQIMLHFLCLEEQKSIIHNRCQKWVENCRRADLEDKTPDQLNKHYRLCAKHFETSMICRTSPYRTVLRDNAIPTIFDLTSHLNNPHSRHRKRIKELFLDMGLFCKTFCPQIFDA